MVGEVLLLPGDKMMIVGQTQSGKSTLATAMARAFDVGSLAMYDPKNDPGAMVPNCARVYSAADAIRHLPGRVCWTPRRANSSGVMDGWDAICERLLRLAERGHSSMVVVHETADLGTPQTIGPAFRTLLQQGANLGGGRASITAILASQRPLGIPKIVRTEVGHVACFTLTDPDDRDLMARLMGDIEHPEWAESIRRTPLPLNRRWFYRGPRYRLELHEPIAMPGPHKETGSNAQGSPRA